MVGARAKSACSSPPRDFFFYMYFSRLSPVPLSPADRPSLVLPLARQSRFGAGCLPNKSRGLCGSTAGERPTLGRPPPPPLPTSRGKLPPLAQPAPRVLPPNQAQRSRPTGRSPLDRRLLPPAAATSPPARAWPTATCARARLASPCTRPRPPSSGRSAGSRQLSGEGVALEGEVRGVMVARASTPVRLREQGLLVPRAEV